MIESGPIDTPFMSNGIVTRSTLVTTVRWVPFSGH